MPQGTDRLGVTVWPQPIHLIEGKLGSGGYDQVVIVYGLVTVQGQSVFIRLDGGDSCRNEVDPFVFQARLNLKCYLTAFAPTDGNLGVGWYKAVCG